MKNLNCAQSLFCPGMGADLVSNSDRGGNPVTNASDVDLIERSRNLSEKALLHQWKSAGRAIKTSGSNITWCSLGNIGEILSRSVARFTPCDLRCAIVTSFLRAPRSLMKMEMIYEGEREPRK